MTLRPGCGHVEGDQGETREESQRDTTAKVESHDFVEMKTKHLMFKAGGETPLYSPVIGRMLEGQGGGDDEDDERHKL